MQRYSKILSALILAALLAAGGVSGQSKETGVIQGMVLDEEKAPLPGATITISSPKLMGTRSAVADPEGKYRIPAIPGGTYTVVAALEGFATVNKAGIVLHAGMTATVDMVLGVSKIEKEVKVVAEAPLIDITDASLSKTYVTQEMLQNLPTSQDTLELLNLAPGIVDLSAYGGGDLTGNSTQIDGVDVTDARFGGGNFTMNIDYNVIEESQVMGLGAPAEYGNFSGAVINVITKSGGNRRSGDAQVYYTAKNWQNQNINPAEPRWGLVPETPVTRLLDMSFHSGWADHQGQTLVLCRLRVLFNEFGNAVHATDDSDDLAENVLETQLSAHGKRQDPGVLQLQPHGPKKGFL